MKAAIIIAKVETLVNEKVTPKEKAARGQSTMAAYSWHVVPIFFDYSVLSSTYFDFARSDGHSAPHRRHCFCLLYVKTIVENLMFEYVRLRKTVIVCVTSS